MARKVPCNMDHRLWLGCFVVDPIHAECAFLHDTFGLIEFPRAVRAGPCAETAADAVAFVDKDDAIFDALIAGAGRTDRDARRVCAMQAGLREVEQLCRTAIFRLNLVGMDPVQEAANRVRAISVRIAQGRAVVLGVPTLTSRHAGMAAHASVEVDDQSERFLGMRRERCHDVPPAGVFSAE